MSTPQLLRRRVSITALDHSVTGKRLPTGIVHTLPTAVGIRDTVEKAKARLKSLLGFCLRSKRAKYLLSHVILGLPFKPRFSADDNDSDLMQHIYIYYGSFIHSVVEEKYRFKRGPNTSIPKREYRKAPRKLSAIKGKPSHP